MDISQIILLSILGLGLIGFILMMIFKKDFVSYLTTSVPILKAVYQVLTITYSLFPNTVWQKIVTIAKVTIDGVVQAEELWKSGELDKDSREKVANAYIVFMLKTAKIEITSTIQTVIDGITKVVCAIMPHSDASKQI